MTGYDQHTNPFQLQPDPSNEKIFQTLWELKKRAKSQHTIKNVSKLLHLLDKNTDLDKPEAVKGYIANLDKRSASKISIKKKNDLSKGNNRHHKIVE